MNTPILECHDLVVVYPNHNGGLLVLDTLSFEIPDHQFISILGPSGCGKTTLLRVLGGLLAPSSGQVLFRGERLTKTTREIGFVFQRANLMPWRTVFRNIALPLEVQGIRGDEAEQKVQQLIDFVGLRGFETVLPRDLSGGMAQRVALARVLVYDPDVLLLDEPFGSLDALTREKMGMELLRIWQARQKTTVMVTHSISESIFMADRVLVLSALPGQIKLDLPIELPRPRIEDMRYTKDFGELVRCIRSAIG